MSVTSAPRAFAATARAIPWRPLERLPRKRTGSRGSRVPPAVMTMRRPARSSPPRAGRTNSPARRRSVIETTAAGWAGADAETIACAAPACPAPLSSTARAARTIVSGSSIRPGPESLPVSCPTAGPTIVTPRLRRVAMFATVAGFCHISVCMAGAMTSGAVLARTVLPSRSSARPTASLAIVFAVAGAITMRSADWPIATCRTSATPSYRSVATGLRLIASRVGRPTKRSAASVATTCTECPSSTSARMTPTALYAAMPPVTPTTMVSRVLTAASPQENERNG